uniref:Uncharacterized protein n=1 Tax=Romanomermis culicivorax TaxID=13658 RepID=A0A915K425_ROMCU
MAFKKSTALAVCLLSLTILMTANANTLYSNSYRSLYQLYPNQQHNVLSLEEEIRHRNHLQRMLENFIKEKERKQQQEQEKGKVGAETTTNLPYDEDDDEEEDGGRYKTNDGSEMGVNETNADNKVQLSNAEKRKMVDLLQKLMNVLRKEYLHDGHYVD